MVIGIRLKEMMPMDMKPMTENSDGNWSKIEYDNQG